MNKLSVIVICILFTHNVVFGQITNNMRTISGGTFVPLYGSDASGIKVNSFMLDTYPITNAQFLAFVKEYPKWKKSKVLRLFADDNYLSKWVGDFDFGTELTPNSAITNVSWYAAKAYCECQGKRLPTMDEWEYAAMASQTKKNAQQDSVFNKMIVETYETPRTYKKDVGSTYKNYWGVYDMHGLVWEWTSDFNSVLISGESRQDVDTEKNLFCGSGAVNASDLMDYAAFMRYAFRGSIKANFCIQNLGFRCAKDLKK